MPSLPKVVNKVEPPSTSIVLSPLIVILTLPEETKNVLANNKIAVNVKTIANKNMIGVIISIYKPFSNYISKPIKPRKARPIKPVIKNAIPTPLKGPGIFAYLILSLIAAISTTAINHPTPDPNP
jgi:hypothetical protein